MGENKLWATIKQIIAKIINTIYQLFSPKGKLALRRIKLKEEYDKYKKRFSGDYVIKNLTFPSVAQNRIGGANLDTMFNTVFVEIEDCLDMGTPLQIDQNFSIDIFRRFLGVKVQEEENGALKPILIPYPEMDLSSLVPAVEGAIDMALEQSKAVIRDVKKFQDRLINKYKNEMDANEYEENRAYLNTLYKSIIQILYTTYGLYIQMADYLIAGMRNKKSAETSVENTDEEITQESTRIYRDISCNIRIV